MLEPSFNRRRGATSPSSGFARRVARQRVKAASPQNQWCVFVQVSAAALDIPPDFISNEPEGQSVPS